MDRTDHTDRSTEQQSELIRLRAENARLREVLSVILGAHDSGNNGAYMGEARLCYHYAEKARAALAGGQS